MSQHWFCKISDKEVGPLSSHQIKALVAKGKLRPEDFVRQGEAGKWVAASRLKGLFPATAAAKSETAQPQTETASPPPDAIADLPGGAATPQADEPLAAPTSTPPASVAPETPAAPATLFSVFGNPLPGQPAAAPAAAAASFSPSEPPPEPKPAAPAPLFSMMDGPLSQPSVTEQPSAAPVAPATLFSMTAPLPEQPAAAASLFPQEPPSLFAGVGGNAAPTPPPGVAPSPVFATPPSVFAAPVEPVATSSAVIPLDRRSGSSKPVAAGAPAAGVPSVADPTTDAVAAANIFAPGETAATSPTDSPRRRKKKSQLPVVLILILFAVMAVMTWLGWKVYKSQTADLAQQQAGAAAKPKSAASADQLSAEVERGGDKPDGKAAKKAAEPAAKAAAAANVKWYNAAQSDFTYGEKNVAVRVQSVLYGIPRFLIGNDVDRSKEQYLLVAIQVQNTGDKEPLKYESWAARGKPSCITLTDNLGKAYAEKSFGTPLADGQYAGGAIPPGKTADDLLFFEVPDKRHVTYLHLEMPAVNINGQGMVTFEIPRAMMGRLRQAMMADAAKHPTSGAPAAKTKADLDDEINHPKGIDLDTAPGVPAAMTPDKPTEAAKSGSAFGVDPAKDK